MENIIIRKINMDDLTGLHELFCDSYVMEYASFEISRKLKHARKFLEYALDNEDKLEVFSIIDKDTNLAGIAILWYINPFEVEIEIFLKREMQQKGIGSYVLNKLILEMKDAGYNYVFANVHKNNLIGQNFVEKKNMFKVYMDTRERKIYIK